MPKGKSRSSRRQVVAELARVLNERAAKLQQEPVQARHKPAAKVKKAPVRKRGYDSLILADGPKGTYSMDPRISQANNNVLVIAGTGGGKTKSVVEANLLHATHQSMTVLLTKRRLLDQYAPLLKRRGYDVKVLDLVHPERSDVGYDPMLHLKDETDIIGLAKALLSNSGCASVKDPYWHTAAADLFTAFIRLVQLLYGDKARMADVLERIQKIDYPSQLDYDEDVVYSPDEFHARKRYIRTLVPYDQFYALREIDPQMFMSWYQFDKNGDKTGACIRSIMVSAVNSVMTKGIRQIMAKPEQLDLTDLVNHKTVLFILTSPVNPALHPFANLVLGALFKELFEYAESLPGGRVPIPLTAICDDFATGGQIPEFQHHISIFREKGIAVMMLVQSLSQLESMYGQAASVTIQDNTDNIIYMGGNNLDTAGQMARRIDKPLDEVLSLPRGQIYLFRNGQKGLQLQRYQIFNDPLYQKEIAPLDAAVNGR